jgi:hypothetical protein
MLKIQEARMRSQNVFKIMAGLGFSVLLILPLAASCSHPSPTASSSLPLVTLTSEINPALPGPVTYFVSVKALGSAVMPTGTLTFSEDSQPFGTAVLDGNGLAICTDPSLAPGVHAISASYSGDSNFAAARSGTVTQLVTNADGTPAAVNTTVTPATYVPVTEFNGGSGV